MPALLAMYQGEDFAQRLLFYTDQARTVPLVFSDPVMDVRAGRTRYATFDITGQAEGTFSIPDPGVLDLAMGWAHTEKVKAATFDLDIFANVNGRRVAITKVGTLQLVVSKRITQDERP